MLQHTPHPAPWVKMRLVSKVQIGDEVVNLDDSVGVCEAIGADPSMNGIGIPAESMLPNSWIICSSSRVVKLPYSVEHCETLSGAGSVSCPLKHSMEVQQQWSSLLEQLRSNVDAAVRSVVHSGSQLPKELRYRIQQMRICFMHFKAWLQLRRKCFMRGLVPKLCEQHSRIIGYL
jgi:hypothetical protein